MRFLIPKAKTTMIRRNRRKGEKGEKREKGENRIALNLR
jgi:hypothetical protein